MQKPIISTLGIDIGGTHITAVLWNGKKILIKKIIDTPSTKKQFIDAINKLTQTLIGGRIINIGISVAGIIRGNNLVKSPNIGYLRNFHFSSIFKKYCPVRIDNDARSFLRCECLIGDTHNFKKTIGLTIGTGIGRAIAVKGEVKKIESLEYPEKWEREYQHIRETKNNIDLANYLSNKFLPIIRRYSPDAMVIGGGVILGRKQKITNPLFKKIKHFSPKIKILIPRFGAYSGAIGGALLFK